MDIRKFNKMKKHHRIIFAVVVGAAVIAFWRGVWGLMDEYLFPNNYKLSLWISLILGIIILIITNYATKELM